MILAPKAEPSPAVSRISSPVSGAMMIPISVDAGVDERLDSVEEHGFVGDRHQLLGGGVGDRPQPGPGPAREDQSLEVLHRRKVSCLLL